MIYISVPCVFDCHEVVSLSPITLVHCGGQIFESVKPRTIHTFEYCGVTKVMPTC